MAKMDIPQELVVGLLEHILRVEPDAEISFCVLLLAAASIGRDVGGLDKETFLENCLSSFEAAPVGMVKPGAPPGAMPGKGELN